MIPRQARHDAGIHLEKGPTARFDSEVAKCEDRNINPDIRSASNPSKRYMKAS